MTETYGELVCRLCRLRDEMKKTPAGREAFADVVDTLGLMAYLEGQGRPVTYEEAKEINGT